MKWVKFEDDFKEDGPLYKFRKIHKSLIFEL